MKRMDEGKPAWSEILFSVLRSEVVYESDEIIKERFPKTSRITTLPQCGVKYFLENFDDRALHVVTVRGTANLINIKLDVEYLHAKDGKLGIHVHTGFDKCVRELYEDLSPHLKRDYRIQTTGHSLGAAVATLLLMYLEHDGFEIAPSINFGQPKVTNRKGVKAFSHLPIRRVIDEEDVVALLPPTDLVCAIHGGYDHLGEEVILLDDEFYVHLDEHAAERHNVCSFWKNIAHESIHDHLVNQYRARSERKLDGAVAVPYEDRLNYCQRERDDAD